MTKDNEVDEKVIEPVAVIYPDSGLRNDAAAMALWRNYGYDTGGEPLYSSDTVAELRVEVERLRYALDSCREAGNKHVQRRCQMDDEIERLTGEKAAAERRVGELEEALRGVMYWDNGKSEWAFARATLTGADPT